MLNRAARYFPILRELRKTIDTKEGCRVLEIGSGAVGLGEFWRHPFVGCDVSFSEKPRPPMQAVKSSGARLPFADKSFDAVIASDVMEHVKPESRRCVIKEALRVSRKVVVVGYPSGSKAFAADQELRARYLKRKKAVPVWLNEHMMYPFPNGDLFSELDAGWTVRKIPNEDIVFHQRLMRLEMYSLFSKILSLGLRVMPGLIERFLKRKDREPSYRKIFVLSRQS